ncbi:PadR family transcriptional regulator [Solwaraspora sp. WMMD1047]|uniref:PadR family transcriptional regulator n=1 Tax=Solwaraspora sp. WMMD1047 TaxID=3016102 RepID=UPI002417D236|nr:PadR family transcriptional regulator [Solwaraspora sp. WMMD1047]MDG4833827.1 PadR family transcriptional regulator [Solwaraspora sp. WMMD1047]
MSAAPEPAGDGTPTGRCDLPATAYAVLGLLSFGRELTGYDLRKWAEHMRFFYWSPAQSQIYAELRRLKSRGLVTERGEPQRGRPDKRYYRITAAGQWAFRHWENQSELEPPVIKHSPMLRLFFGHQADPDRLHELLAEYLDWLEQQRAELHQIRADLLPEFPYPHLVAVWGHAFYDAELASVQAVLDELDRMSADPPD